jgi:hypothetical protein
MIDVPFSNGVHTHLLCGLIALSFVIARRCISICFKFFSITSGQNEEPVKKGTAAREVFY